MANTRSRDRNDPEPTDKRLAVGHLCLYTESTWRTQLVSKGEFPRVFVSTAQNPGVRMEPRFAVKDAEPPAPCVPQNGQNGCGHSGVLPEHWSVTPVELDCRTQDTDCARLAVNTRAPGGPFIRRKERPRNERWACVGIARSQRSLRQRGAENIGWQARSTTTEYRQPEVRNSGSFWRGRASLATTAELLLSPEGTPVLTIAFQFPEEDRRTILATAFGATGTSTPSRIPSAIPNLLRDVEQLPIASNSTLVKSTIVATGRRFLCQLKQAVSTPGSIS